MISDSLTRHFTPVALYGLACVACFVLKHLLCCECVVRENPFADSLFEGIQFGDYMYCDKYHLNVGYMD